MNKGLIGIYMILLKAKTYQQWIERLTSGELVNLIAFSKKIEKMMTK